MFEFVRQDLQRGGRVNQIGAGDFSSTGRISIGHFPVFSDPGRVVRNMSVGRKLAKVGTGPTPGSVSGQSLATR